MPKPYHTPKSDRDEAVGALEEAEARLEEAEARLENIAIIATAVRGVKPRDLEETWWRVEQIATKKSALNFR
jgi:hypothetical protein